MGQVGGDVLDNYEKHEVDAFLKEDAEKLSNWIEDQLLDKSVPEFMKEFWKDQGVETIPLETEPTARKKLFEREKR